MICDVITEYTEWVKTTDYRQIWKTFTSKKIKKFSTTVFTLFIQTIFRIIIFDKIKEMEVAVESAPKESPEDKLPDAKPEVSSLGFY